MKKLNKNFLAILAIFVLPIPSLFWLPRGEVLAHGIIQPWFNVSALWENATRYLFAWVNIAGFGNSNTEPSCFLYRAYKALAVAIGGSSHGGQVLFLYFGFVGCMGSMFILARTLGFTPIASLISGAFYLLSPMVMSGMPLEITNLRVLPFYVATPFLFSLVVRAMRPHSSKRELAIFGIVSLFLGSAGYSTLQYFVLHLILIGSYVISSIALAWSNRDARVKVVRKSLTLFIIMFLANFYWLGHLLFSLHEAYVLRAEPGFTDVGVIEGLSVKLIDGFRMLPYPAHASIFPWVAYYYAPLMTLITFGFVAISAFALLSCKTRCTAIFPGVLLVIILFLGKGIREPLSAVGKIIFLSHPYVTRLFRNPTYFETIAVFALTLLIGLAIGEIMRIASTKSWKHLTIAVITVTTLLVMYGWQFLIGGPIRSQSKDSCSQSVKVPLCYTEFAQYLHDDDEDFRILSIPTFTRQSMYVAYRWQKLFVGSPFLNIWSGKPTFNPVYPGSSGVNPLFDSAMHPQSNIISQDTWRALLQIANVRYVTFHDDTDWAYLCRSNPAFAQLSEEKIYGFVDKSPFMKKVKNFGKIELYQLDSKAFLPHFYIPSTPNFVSGDIEALVPLSQTKYLEGKPALLFSEQNQNSNIKNQNLEKINNFVFKDSNWQDLAVEMAGLQVSELESKKSKVKIEKPGVYEFYVNTPEMDDIPELEIKVDGKEIALVGNWGMGRWGRKYIKLGEFEIKKKGKRQINIKYQNKKQNLKIILVNKEERERLEKEIGKMLNESPTEICYIFEKEKVEFYIP
ncbi:MAG: hypothetical protein NC818_01425 [Candidatus Omnitrophica bacterium]|nr:hypothetical protein [Candidatus Omnitrophota bacterium]